VSAADYASLASLYLLVALVGFNLGVEIGQLAIIAVFLPLAFALRRSWLYRRLVFIGGSAAIVVVAGIWLVERAFDLKRQLKNIDKIFARVFTNKTAVKKAAASSKRKAERRKR